MEMIYYLKLQRGYFMIDREYIECGKILNTHGVGGYVRIDSYSDTLDDNLKLNRMFLKSSSGYSEYEIEKISPYKSLLLVKFKKINSFDEAVRLKNQYVYAFRDDYGFDENRIFLSDIISLPAYDFNSGKIIGKVDDILTDRVQNIYVLKNENGSETLVPDVSAFVKKIIVSGDNKGVYFTLIEGLGNDEN